MFACSLEKVACADSDDVVDVRWGWSEDVSQRCRHLYITGRVLDASVVTTARITYADLMCGSEDYIEEVVIQSAVNRFFTAVDDMVRAHQEQAREKEPHLLH